MIGRDVVDAGDERRERDVFQAWHQLLDAGADRCSPARTPFVDVAAPRKVAGEHTPIGEVFHRKGELWGDDERLEQALLDRIAEEEVAILG